LSHIKEFFFNKRYQKKLAPTEVDKNKSLKYTKNSDKLMRKTGNPTVKWTSL
jgi:hypothetical protein